MRLLTFITRPYLSLIAALVLAACTTWQPLARDSTGAPLARLPYAVRITRLDSSRVALLAPFLRQDTLFGRRARDTLAVPLHQIRGVERQQFSVVRTAAAILAIPVAFVIVYTIKCGDHRCGPSPAL
jgi:hypothetical protein